MKKWIVTNGSVMVMEVVNYGGGGGGWLMAAYCMLSVFIKLHYVMKIKRLKTEFLRHAVNERLIPWTKLELASYLNLLITFFLFDVLVYEIWLLHAWQRCTWGDIITNRNDAHYMRCNNIPNRHNIRNKTSCRTVHLSKSLGSSGDKYSTNVMWQCGKRQCIPSVSHIHTYASCRWIKGYYKTSVK